MKCRSRVDRNFTLSFASACSLASSECWARKLVTTPESPPAPLTAAMMAFTASRFSCSYSAEMLAFRSRQNSISASGPWPFGALSVSCRMVDCSACVHSAMVASRRLSMS